MIPVNCSSRLIASPQPASIYEIACDIDNFIYRNPSSDVDRHCINRSRELLDYHCLRTLFKLDHHETSTWAKAREGTTKSTHMLRMTSSRMMMATRPRRRPKRRHQAKEERRVLMKSLGSYPLEETLNDLERASSRVRHSFELEKRMRRTENIFLARRVSLSPSINIKPF